jgi:hypothetical protein
MANGAHIWGVGRRKLVRLAETPVLFLGDMLIERGMFF